MRRGFVIFMVLFSVFLAIGCTGSNKGQTATSNETPAVTPVNTSQQLQLIRPKLQL